MSLDVSKLNYEFIILRRLEYIRPETIGNEKYISKKAQIHILFSIKIKNFFQMHRWIFFLVTSYNVGCHWQRNFHASWTFCVFEQSGQYINDFNWEIISRRYHHWIEFDSFCPHHYKALLWKYILSRSDIIRSEVVGIFRFLLHKSEIRTCTKGFDFLCLQLNWLIFIIFMICFFDLWCRSWLKFTVIY